MPPEHLGGRERLQPPPLAAAKGTPGGLRPSPAPATRVMAPTLVAAFAMAAVLAVALASEETAAAGEGGGGGGGGGEARRR